eukprot:464832-Rhodomonas_salina.2
MEKSKRKDDSGREKRVGAGHRERGRGQAKAGRVVVGSGWGGAGEKVETAGRVRRGMTNEELSAAGRGQLRP